MKGSNSILAIYLTGEEALVAIVFWLVIWEVNLTESLAEKERGGSGVWFCKKIKKRRR